MSMSDSQQPGLVQYIQYFVCGIKINSQGYFDGTDTDVKFFNGNQMWLTSPNNATRCDQVMALQYLSEKQSSVDLSKRDNFFLVRADVSLTKVKIKLEVVS